MKKYNKEGKSDFRSDKKPFKRSGSKNSFDARGRSNDPKRQLKGSKEERDGSGFQRPGFSKSFDFRKPERKSQGRFFNKEEDNKNFLEPDRFGKKEEDSKNKEEFRTVYKGRGRDQKPVFGTEKVGEDKRKGTKKFFNKSKPIGNRPSEERPSYNFKKVGKSIPKESYSEDIRLNKYIANSGVCSRREADTLITKGDVSVNGEIIRELGYKVKRTDKVQYKGRNLSPEPPTYILLNKPKDFITTTDDPMERKTVMQLVSSAGKERIFPVGRLDRNTTGLLLFTNDGELAEKLAHPSNKIKKIYQVTLDKAITKRDEETILEGLTLEDGPVLVDDMQVLSKDRTILGLEIHIGRNRIVRRIFAHLGYDVVALDRVIYAGLSKKDLSRGKYRYLTEKEVIQLKYFK